MNLRAKVGKPGFRQCVWVILAVGLLSWAGIRSSAWADVSIQDLNTLADALLKTQTAHASAKEEIVATARSRAAPRVRRQKTAELENAIKMLDARLVAIRGKFRVVAKTLFFDPGKDVRGSFTLTGQTGEYHCASSDQGKTGICTLTNTNQTFGW
jgi:hypothetical protein